MKNNLRSILFSFVMLLMVNNAYAQGGIITKVISIPSPYGVAVDDTGNVYTATSQGGGDLSNLIWKNTLGSIIPYIIAGEPLKLSGYSGDGGTATAALLYEPVDVAIDNGNNLYIVDNGNNNIRKVNSAGIISTIAGGLGIGYGGDGGAATAAVLNAPEGIAVDGTGNIYIADWGNNVIRKVDTFGIISTIAGNDALGIGYSGDGGAATAAQLNGPYGIAVDDAGNIYFAEQGNNVIRKVNTSGIISTIAGNHILGYGGDGGPATAAEFYNPTGVAVDAAGNIYIADGGNNVIRKVNPVTGGIITTVAGNYILGSGYSGDDGPATDAQLSGPNAVTADVLGNIYIADANGYIRKVTHSFDFTHAADSFSIFINSYCGGPQITVVTNQYTAAMSVRTYFGDGTTDTTSIAKYGLTSGYAIFTHHYTLSGTYTIKSVLINGTTAVDSMYSTYNYVLCNTMPVQFYNDVNKNCKYDTGIDFNIYLPMLIEVDSNGVVIDTMSATSGFYYNAYGVPGDVYTFKVISIPAALIASCPSTGIITDTFQSIAYTVPTEFMAFQCAAGDSFDLSVNANLICGRHRALGGIIVNNASCSPEDATLTMQFSPKYIYGDAYPTPSSVSGNTVVWNMSALSSVSGVPVGINFSLAIPGAWLTLGDTVFSDYKVTPYAGDIDTLNNVEIFIDTIRGSFDPNEMSVTPSGNILTGTQLQYTINFTNTGNDTAFNIYVIDTLSDNVDIHSLRLVTASNTMNIAMLKSGGHNIVKFDFPAINLLDSLHHPNQCSGAVIFNINTKAGLPNGATIFNHAGIFFDDNPVVMTGTVENVIGFPASVNNTKPSTGAVHIYPNPANDVLTIKIDGEAYSSFTISNTLGEVVLQQGINAAQTTIGIKAFPAGVYYVTLKGESGVVVKKFIKE